MRRIGGDGVYGSGGQQIFFSSYDHFQLTFQNVSYLFVDV